MSILDDLSSAIRTVHDSAGPAVVGIGQRRARQRRRHRRRPRPDQRPQPPRRRGHRDLPRRTIDAWQVLGVDPDGDLAVVDVDTAGATPLAWSDAEASIGDVVFGLASTGAGAARVTAGTVSAIEQTFRGPGGSRIGGSLEHTAPLAPGSSGGPLVDGSGRFLAINTNRIGEGFYLARPADAALRERVDALSRGESTSRPRLGIAIAPSAVAQRLRRSVGLSEREGLLVRGVEDGSPADRAGIREGDLLIEAAGRPLADSDALAAILAEAGMPIELKIVRGDEERAVSVGGTTDASGEA